jgi:hypothetical protein
MTKKLLFAVASCVLLVGAGCVTSSEPKQVDTGSQTYSSKTEEFSLKVRCKQLFTENKEIEEKKPGVLWRRFKYDNSRNSCIAEVWEASMFGDDYGRFVIDYLTDETLFYYSSLEQPLKQLYDTDSLESEAVFTAKANELFEE